MQSYLTNWLGDDGWLAEFRDEIRRFNYLGDTQFLSGEVVAASEQDGHGAAEVEVRCTNQRDEVTAQARASVLLPSRTHGLVLPPQPPAELQRQAITMLRRHHALPPESDGPLPGLDVR